MPGTSRPTTASDVSASRPKICGIQYDANPASAACRADATTSSIPPTPATSPPKIPMRMRRRLSRPRGGGRAGAILGGLADVAQLVEHHLAKVRVAGSNPVVRSNSFPHQRPLGAAVRVRERQHEGVGPRLGRGRFAGGAPEARVEGPGELAARFGEQVPIAVGG